jgi:hypothetical protein
MRPLYPEVMPARNSLPRALRAPLTAIGMSTAFLVGVHWWALAVGSRPELRIERMQAIPVPWLCENSGGVWQRCRWEPTR